MGAVARIFADSVMGWYRRRLAGVPEARGGVVTVIQRSSSDMKLNPHLHAIAVDGVYVPGPDGIPTFLTLPRLKTDEVGDVLLMARVRILRYLSRRGVVRLLPEALEINDELAERDPVLAQLAAAAVSGLSSASTVVGRTLSMGAGYLISAAGWPVFFATTMAMAAPALVMLRFLPKEGPRTAE